LFWQFWLSLDLGLLFEADDEDEVDGDDLCLCVSFDVVVIAESSEEVDDEDVEDDEVEDEEDEDDDVDSRLFRDFWDLLEYLWSLRHPKSMANVRYTLA
jgi:TATA-binding protein-associated factor Taf7